MLSPFWVNVIVVSGLPRWLSGKKYTCWCRRLRRWGFDPWVDPLEEEMATYSCVLTWTIPWTEHPGGLQSMESQRVGHDWASERTCMHAELFNLLIPSKFIFIFHLQYRKVYSVFLLPHQLFFLSLFSWIIFSLIFLKHLDIHVQWEYFILRVTLNLL